MIGRRFAAATAVRDRLRPAWLMAIDAASSLLARPGHAVGMMSGILLAVASVTATVAIADTQQAQIDLRFDLQRSGHVVLMAQSPPEDGFPAGQVALIAGLEPVSAAGEFSVWRNRVAVGRSSPSRVESGALLVAAPGGFRASESEVIAGAGESLLAGGGSLPLAWVGHDLAARLGVAPVSADPGVVVDAQIIIDGRPYSVAGIVRNDRGFEYVNGAVIVARGAAPPGAGENVRLVAHVRPGAAAAVATYAKGSLDPTGELSLLDVTPPDGELLLAGVGGDLRQIGAALGGIVGLVGMIAIANTLMVSVHNRQRELGLRSAMGWSRRRIGMLILTESGFAGVAAGILGSAIGLAASAVWCWAYNWTHVVPPSLPWVVVLAGTAASLTGGLIPALRAASVSPLTAMRS